LVPAAYIGRNAALFKHGAAAARKNKGRLGVVPDRPKSNRDAVAYIFTVARA